MTGSKDQATVAALRVRTAFGEFEITATERGVRSVLPVRDGAGVPAPPCGDGAARQHAEAAAGAMAARKVGSVVI